MRPIFSIWMLSLQFSVPRVVRFHNEPSNELQASRSKRRASSTDPSQLVPLRSNNPTSSPVHRSSDGRRSVAQAPECGASGEEITHRSCEGGQGRKESESPSSFDYHELIRPGSDGFPGGVARESKRKFWDRYSYGAARASPVDPLSWAEQCLLWALRTVQRSRLEQRQLGQNDTPRAARVRSVNPYEAIP